MGKRMQRTDWKHIIIDGGSQLQSVCYFAKKGNSGYFLICHGIICNQDETNKYWRCLSSDDRIFTCLLLLRSNIIMCLFNNISRKCIGYVQHMFA